MHPPVRLACVATVLWASAAVAQQVPESADQVAQLGGTLPGNPDIELVKVVDGLHDPTDVTSAGDGSGRLFVTERVGRVKVVKDGELLDKPFLDLTTMNPLGSFVQTQFMEQGLYSVAFHPDFAENGHFFVHYASLPFNGDGMIVRFTVSDDDPDVADPESAKVVMQIDQPYYNHNGGEIGFGPDGYLYIGSGDGGWEGDPLEAGQDLSTWLGKILRIDVDTEDGPYTVPADNPFVEKQQLMRLFGITEDVFADIHTRAKAEIWAYGLRNPYQFSFDRETGDLYIAEVGQNHWEEIDFQPASSEGGENYGWDFNMGTHCFPIDEESCPTVGTLPIAEYPHDEGGCSVIGFGVANYAGMNGVYLFGDWCTGRVWGTGWDQEAGRWQMQELAQASLNFTGGGYGDDGAVYAVNCDCFYTTDKGAMENPPGALWKIVAADSVPEGATTATQQQE
ncbi:MAG: hypothetical protein CMM50_11005 [Rhodospirillaceae bacterium]|nr:hypothetical protein [Rhodospirillaceae bacterium]